MLTQVVGDDAVLRVGEHHRVPVRFAWSTAARPCGVMHNPHYLEMLAARAVV